jgi:glycosyltransferase involved in cell wall biosynthesis
VADDGSRPDTGELVEEWRQRLPIPVRHLWQEDEGFRLSRIRNSAIAAATGEYILFIDGDMVLHRHFVVDHKRAAERGHFVQGVRVLTGMETGARMIREKKLDLRLLEPGIERRRHLIRSRLLSRLLLLREHSGQRAIRGSNQGYWRENLLRVNGFNEEMTGWGREDNEIAARLYHSGVLRRNLRFGGLAIHLWHRTRILEGENPNDRFLHETIETRATRCDRGIDGHLEDQGAPAS